MTFWDLLNAHWFYVECVGGFVGVMMFLGFVGVMLFLLFIAWCEGHE